MRRADSRARGYAVSIRCIAPMSDPITGRICESQCRFRKNKILFSSLLARNRSTTFVSISRFSHYYYSLTSIYCRLLITLSHQLSAPSCSAVCWRPPWAATTAASARSKSFWPVRWRCPRYDVRFVMRPYVCSNVWNEHMCECWMFWNEHVCGMLLFECLAMFRPCMRSAYSLCISPQVRSY